MPDLEPDATRRADVVGYAPVRTAKTADLATRALALGAMGIIPAFGIIPALVGIVSGIVSLATRRPGTYRAVAGIVLGLLLPPLSMAALSSFMYFMSDVTKRNSCGSVLAELGTATRAYSHDYAGTMPPSLEVLVAEKYASPGHLRSASAGGKWKVDFFYHPCVVGADPDCIVACDFARNHDMKDRHVLYWDGRVKWMSEKQFQAELAKPNNADFAAALRAAE